jgi:hypothetical protein
MKAHRLKETKYRHRASYFAALLLELLSGLSEDEVAHFMALTSGTWPSDAVRRAIYRQTEGNPFFLTEVVRLLVAEGQQTVLVSPQCITLPLPQGIREAIQRRLQRLSRRCLGWHTRESRCQLLSKV